MLDRLSESLNFNAKALVLRADRQRVIAGNIANVDTPGFVARDFNFAETLQSVSKPGQLPGSSVSSSLNGLSSTHANHFELGAQTATAGSSLGYAVATQPSMDGNSVDLDRERAAFADNAIRYESTLRFINSQVKTMLSAIQGQ